MVKMKWLYLLFAVLITTLGCIDEIDFTVEDGETILAIEGQLSDSLMSHTVTISKSIAYGAQSEFTTNPISGATVILKSSVDADEEFFETEPGEYVYYGAGKIGASYSLLVTLTDGSSYQSTTHTITPPVPIGNLVAQVYTEEYLNSNNVIAIRDGVELTLSSKLEKDGEPTFAIHQVQGEFKFEEFYPRILNIRTCYIKENLNFEQIMIFSGAELPDYSIKNERILDSLSA